MATIRKRGEYQWEAQIRKRGFPAQSKTFNTKAEAEAWVAVIESEMVRGVFVSRTEAESTTLYEAFERYANEVANGKKGVKEDLYRIRAFQRLPLAKCYLSNIRSIDLANYRDERLACGYAPATVKRELALVSHLFNVARKEWGMHSVQNPIELIRHPSVRNERERRILSADVYQEKNGVWISERLDEIEMLTRHTDSLELPNFLIVAVESAMRRGEILGLCRADVDTGKRVAHLADTKNGSDRDVPLSTKALAALNGMALRADSRIFSIRPDVVTRAFSRALERARKSYVKGLQAHLEGGGLHAKEIGQRIESDFFLVDLHLHDLRHEATSRLAGIFPMHDLAKITGHKDTRMLLRYYHPKAEDLAKMLD